MTVSTKRSQRLYILELLSYWEGEINSTSLVQIFGISRQQASNDIQYYRRQYPAHLHYNASVKAYLATRHFNPALIRCDVSEYLDWIQTSQLPQSQNPITVAHAELPQPVRRVSALIMRGLIAAIRKQQRLEVDYISLTNPNSEGRIIAPHTFIKTGLRWHLRAWCEKSQQYRDFVLSRFRGQPELQGESQHPRGQDKAWNTEITLIFKADPRLSPTKREVLENDYQMKKSQLKINTRACLVQYLLQEMQVSTKTLDDTPEAQQLVLVNIEDIKPWLFDS